MFRNFIHAVFLNRFTQLNNFSERSRTSGLFYFLKSPPLNMYNACVIKKQKKRTLMVYESCVHIF